MKPIPRIFLGLFGAGGLLFALPCMMAMLYNLVTFADNPGVSLAFLCIAMVLATPAGFAMFKAITAKPPPLENSQKGVEQLIYQTAKAYNGHVSATHIAMETPLSIEQADNALKELEIAGRIYSEVTIHGGTNFIFPEFSPEHAALNAPLPTEFEQFDTELAEQNHVLDLDSPQQEDPNAHVSPQTQPAHASIDPTHKQAPL